MYAFHIRMWTGKGMELRETGNRQRQAYKREMVASYRVSLSSHLGLEEL